MRDIEKGERLFAEGKIEEAEKCFLDLLKNDPKNPETLNNLGVIQHAKGNLQEAEDLFIKALAANEGYLDALLNLADLYQNTKRWKEACIHLEKCIEIENTDPNLFNQLGTIYLEMTETEKARVTLKKSLELNPDQQIVADSLRALEKKGSAPRIAISGKPLNILFVQEAPCIRNYKMATALRSRGHRVSLAYNKARLSQMYKGLSDDVYDENIHISNFRQLWDLSRNYDIVHCHNEPDILTVAALAGDAPVIHDTHDLISLRANADPNLSYFEGVANRGASGRVYTTPYQMEEAQKLYGVNGPSLVFYNYVSQSDLLKSTLPKRSAQDGKVHIVYEGGIGENGHRDFSSLFVELAKEGIHIHIYPTFYSREIARGFSAYKTIHYYQPLSPRQIMEEMTQYDFGIIPFNLEKGNRRFLDSTIANKLFEYMAAGLPVIASSLQSYIDYFKKTPIGITFENAEDIIKNIPKLKEIAETTDFSKLIFTYEGEIERLESFYLVLINGCSTNGRAASGRAFRAEPRPSGYRASIEYADSQEFYSQEDRVRNRRKKEKDPNFYDELFSSGGWQNEYHKHYTESIYYSAWSRALEWIKQIPNPKIIEVGCGPGQLANMFFDNEICDYRGIDFSAVAIEMAKENNKMHPDVFMVDNAYNSEIFSSDYNTVVLLEVLEHIDNDLLVLNKIRKNAHVIFSVPNYYSYSHMRWFDSKDEILERYGNIVDIESIFETNFRPTQNKIYLVKGIKG